MNEEELRAWLDPHNRQLLTEIEQTVPVRFTLLDGNSYGCQVHKDEQGVMREVEVFYKEPLSQAKIAHEMLHAKVDIVLGNGITLFDVPNMTIALEGLLANASQIVNACEHVIFFRDYLGMGYREEDSFEEYNLSEETRNNMDFLCNHGLKQGCYYDVNRVFQYLSLAFTLRFYPNEDRFSGEIDRLRRLDRVLFSKVECLWDVCMELEIVPDDSALLQNAYRNFSITMNSWFRANRPR